MRGIGMAGTGTAVACLPPAFKEERMGETTEAPGRHGHVLYVDDEPVLLTIGEHRLSAAGYEVTGANDPTRALELFTATPDQFDLVVTDLSMPRMTGMELAQAIHRIRPDLPVLLLTGFMQEFTPDELSGTGIRGVLIKPVPTQVLLEEVGSLLRAG